MKQKHIGVALVLGVLLLLATVPAQATTVCNHKDNVAPGQTFCGTIIYLTSTATASGSGNLKNFRFTVLRAPSITGPWQTIYDDPSLSFTAVWDSGNFPSYFPGYFQTCGKRPTTDVNPGNLDVCIGN
jgi:hypothetical protein